MLERMPLSSARLRHQQIVSAADHSNYLHGVEWLSEVSLKDIEQVVEWLPIENIDQAVEWLPLKDFGQ